MESVEQGYVASNGENEWFSEAVIVNYNPDCINLKTLIEIYLHTHKSTSNHSMRTKYRSAVYMFSVEQHKKVEIILAELNKGFSQQLITKVLRIKEFKASRKQIRNYYYNNPSKSFCEQFIDPKLKLLLAQFKENVDIGKVNHLI